MDLTYWHKQQSDKPLYPDLLWSRPENARLAGKLLIIGGSAQGFAAAGEAYAEAVKAGIGTARVLLPDSLQKTVGRVLETGEYAPSTPSGSFSRRALAEMLDHSAWADGVLLAGDLGRNSETAILLESYVTKYTGQLILTKDAADYFIKSPQQILDRAETLLVISFSQLQKMAINAGFTTPFQSDMGLIKFVQALHELTSKHSLYIMSRYEDNIVVAVSGQISSIKIKAQGAWRSRTAAHAATWWLQNPSKPFEALTTSLVSTV